MTFSSSFLPYVSLFFSGMASLLLQEVWMRSCLPVFGTTTLAVTVVISVFMAGLTLGNFFVGKILSWIRRPFFAYVCIEASLAFLSLILGWVLKNWTLGEFFHQILLVLALLGPTFLMGMTLPVVVEGLREMVPSSSVSLAYGLNTLGAASGALLGAFWMIPSQGVSQTGIWASGFFLLASLISFPFRGYFLKGSKSPPILKRKSSSSQKRFILTMAFICGGSGMALELVWTRLLSLIFGPSVYALGMVLFVYLMGIAVGSLLSSRIFSSLPFHISLPGTLLAGVIGLGWSTLSFGLMPYGFLELVQLLHPAPTSLRLIEGFLSFATLFPTALVQGMLFPLLVKEYPSPKQAGKETAWVLGWNTFGGIIGISCVGLWLIPEVGFFAILMGISVLYSVGAWMALSPSFKLSVGVFILFFLSFFFYTASQTWDRSVLASGVYKYAIGNALSGKEEAKIEVGNILFYKEGISSTVAVIETQNDRVLSVDGKADASAKGDRSTQVLLSALPLSLSKETRKVLVIGFASGVTAGVASLFPSTQVTSVDIEPSVYEASSFFQFVNHGPLQSPPHELKVDDARHYLVKTQERFDVITSEPSNPWMSGVAPLFTKEFFQLAFQRLAPGGIVCQWLPIYGMEEKLVGSILKTFSSIFPHNFVFESVEGYDLLLLGSSIQIELDPRKMEDRWKTSSLKKELKRIRIQSGADLLGLFLMGNEGIQKFSAFSSFNTDDNGYLEFRAPLSLHLRTAEENNRKLSKVSEGFLPYVDFSSFTAGMKISLQKKLQERQEYGLIETLPW